MRSRELRMSGNQIESLLYGPRDYRAVSRLDDRTLDQIGIRDHRCDDIAVRRFLRKPGRCRPANEFYRPQARLRNESREALSVECTLEIVDPIAIYAVFTKQRCQVSARRSRGFFVDNDL